MRDSNCENCKFFKKYEYSETWGECHRFPPKIVSLQQGSGTTLFPEVGKQTWCGEFNALDQPIS